MHDNNHPFPVNVPVNGAFTFIVLIQYDSIILWIIWIKRDSKEEVGKMQSKSISSVPYTTAIMNTPHIIKP